MPLRTSDGSVAFQLGRINEALDTIKQTLSEDRTASAQYRTDIRREMAGQTDRIQKIEACQNECRSDIAEIKPIVDALRVASHQEAGAADQASRTGRAFGAALNAIAGLFGATIAIVVEKLFFHK